MVYITTAITMICVNLRLHAANKLAPYLIIFIMYKET